MQKFTRLMLVLIGVLLILPACSNIKEKINTVQPKVQVQDIKLRNITLSTTSLEFQLSIDNPNNIGATINKLTYDTYFKRDGNWVLLGSGEKSEIEIKPSVLTTLNIPYFVENKEAIRALIEFISQDNQIEIKVNGTVVIKVGPVSFSIPFVFTKSIKYDLPIPPLPKVPLLPGKS